jgi:hypothetical protein
MPIANFIHKYPRMLIFFAISSINELFLQLYEIVSLLIIFLKPTKNMKEKKLKNMYLFHKNNFVI